MEIEEAVGRADSNSHTCTSNPSLLTHAKVRSYQHLQTGVIEEKEPPAEIQRSK